MAVYPLKRGHLAPIHAAVSAALRLATPCLLGPAMLGSDLGRRSALWRGGPARPCQAALSPVGSGLGLWVGGEVGVGRVQAAASWEHSPGRQPPEEQAGKISGGGDLCGRALEGGH